MMLAPIILSLAQIVFVTWFVIRTSRKYSSTFSAKKNSLTKIGTTFIFLTTVISALADPASWMFFIPLVCSILISVAAPLLISKNLESLCSKGFQDFIGSVIFEMKCGKALVPSARAHLDGLPPPLRVWLTERIIDPSGPSESRTRFLPPNLKNSVLELEKIALQKTAQLDQLLHLQKQIRLDAVLRHRSRQALMQTRIQCFFIVFLFLGVAIYGWNSYPWELFRPFLGTAFILLAFGLLVLSAITRKTKWKT